jgi:hypothetical protein
MSFAPVRYWSISGTRGFGNWLELSQLTTYCPYPFLFPTPADSWPTSCISEDAIFGLTVIEQSHTVS